MSKIIRTPTRAEGGITPEEKAEMDKITQKWIANAFKTTHINKDCITKAIHGLYEVTGLKKPRVVIVPSPCVMALAYGLAAGVWHLRKHGKSSKTTYDATRDATYAATRDATYAATRGATDVATYDATRGATNAATRGATDVATYDATNGATHAATDNATNVATHAATYDATRDATHVATYATTRDATYDDWLVKLAKHFGGNDYKLLLDCCSRWTNAYQGGNMWSSFPAYAEACRDVLGLTGLKCWEKYLPYEQATIEGGFRVMHEEFCIVSDFPEILKVDDKNRPHCATGPSHRWRDGFEIYHLNGVRVPKYLVMTHEGELDINFFLKEKNADIKTEFIRKYGVERMLEHGKLIDTYKKYNNKVWYDSEYEVWDMRKIFEGITRYTQCPFLKMRNQTTGIWHLEGISPKSGEVKTIKQALEIREKIEQDGIETLWVA